MLGHMVYIYIYDEYYHIIEEAKNTVKNKEKKCIISIGIYRNICIEV